MKPTSHFGSPRRNEYALFDEIGYRPDGSDRMVRGWRATCSTPACGGQEIINGSGNRSRLPPEMMKKTLERRGWEITKKAAYCPACSLRRPKPEAVIEPTPEPIVEKEIEVPPTPNLSIVAPKPSQQAVAPQSALDKIEVTGRDIRRIIGALEEEFVDAEGRYRPGSSDRSIADKLKLPLAAITKVRLDSFGEIKSIAELDNLKKEIDDALTKLAELQSRVVAVEKAVRG